MPILPPLAKLASFPRQSLDDTLTTFTPIDEKKAHLLLAGFCPLKPSILRAFLPPQGWCWAARGRDTPTTHALIP
jgi:hypothetical protein